MENIILQTHNLLLKKNLTISTAESCTCGILSSLLTRYPGSSKYFILGTATYSNLAKTKILNIPKKIITKYGAVSQKVASLMAKNIRKISRTDLSIGITGVAGPTGGSSDKPVGTVFIALESKNKSVCKKFIFKGNREDIRKQAALKALKILKNLL
jgi:PncC family amidohydrolase